ncbi:MAG: tRNA 2-selenouridine(34) synthase MnmH [Betaproteobacteria bacterium]|nr:tRNA 2-selenouridine(34) synthase MnmH [Betaproteobacteria bacterium]
MRPDSADYRTLFLQGVPLLDVRAPLEFRKGAFPGAVNQPLMNDTERQKVGTCYTQQGAQAAVELGHRLVSGALREARIAGWAEFARTHPQGYLYCFRGGLRSQIAQQWLAEAGIAYPRVSGGYKAMRTFLLETIEAALAECDWVLVGGLTGTGKTDVLLQVHGALDLERHANHRGSSFGRHATPQPSQIDFENVLAIDLLRQRAAGTTCFVTEDESPIVGSCSVPFALYQRMQQAPIVWLEDGFDARVERILRDYVVGLCAEFTALHGEEEGQRLFAERLRQSLSGIARRLGGVRLQALSVLMDEALEAQLSGRGVDLHRAWIATLLREYYDPMYAFQRERKEARIEFSGAAPAVLDYLRRRESRKSVAGATVSPARARQFHDG